jgi:hypothetical protein
MVLDIVNAQLNEFERRRRKAAALQTVEPAPALAGDRHREAVRNRNREALQRFEQKTQSISGAPQTQQHTA